MKLLIVGCKGFLGSHVMDAFVESYDAWGCDVHTNYNEKRFFLINSSSVDFLSLFRQHKFDLCINCSGAASVPDSLKNPQLDFEWNVRNVQLLLEAIRREAPACKLINLSSAAVYGNPQNLPVQEIEPLKPMSPYGFHKMLSEQICTSYSQFFQIQVCNLRIFSAYGPRLKKQILWDLFLKSKQASAIELFGTGNETRDFIYVDDIIRAIECVIEKGCFSADIYNVASGHAASIKKVSEIFLKMINWNGVIRFSNNIRPGDPVFWQADINKLKDLGFVPKIALEEGIQRYTEWLKSSE